MPTPLPARLRCVACLLSAPLLLGACTAWNALTERATASPLPPTTNPALVALGDDALPAPPTDQDLAPAVALLQPSEHTPVPPPLSPEERRRRTYEQALQIAEHTAPLTELEHPLRPAPLAPAPEPMEDTAHSHTPPPQDHSPGPPPRESLTTHPETPIIDPKPPQEIPAPIPPPPTLEPLPTPPLAAPEPLPNPLAPDPDEQALADAGLVSQWNVEAGEDLIDALQRWATRTTTWTAVKETHYRWPIDAPATFRAPFLDALSALQQTMTTRRPQPVIVAYHHNRVIVLHDDATRLY